jgi:hypothetical protein
MKRPLAIFVAGLTLRLVGIAYLSRVMPRMLSWGVNEAGAIDAGALAGLIVVFRRSRNVALSLLAVLAVYPLIYYASQVVSRYRHPIDPVLYALSGVALSQIIQRRATKRDDAIG